MSANEHATIIGIAVQRQQELKRKMHALEADCKIHAGWAKALEKALNNPADPHGIREAWSNSPSLEKCNELMSQLEETQKALYAANEDLRKHGIDL